MSEIEGIYVDVELTWVAWSREFRRVVGDEAVENLGSLRKQQLRLELILLPPSINLIRGYYSPWQHSTRSPRGLLFHPAPVQCQPFREFNPISRL